MRIRQNPFYLLDVKPEDTVNKINEAAENKSFLDDDNEHLYEEARLILSSPSKRIMAELRYVYSNSLDDDMVSLYYDPDEERISLDKFLRPDLYTSDSENYTDYETFIRAVELMYSIDNPEFIADLICDVAAHYPLLTKVNNLDKITQIINTSRIQAGIALLEINNKQLLTEIASLENDAIDAINNVFSRFSEADLIKIFNTVVKSINETNGDIINDAINIYAIKFKELLGYQKEKIIYEINDLRDDLAEDGIAQLCKDVRYFDYVAQPIQVYLLLNGQSDLQLESVDVANAVRDFAIELFKDKKQYGYSKKLLDLEIELFSELPEFFENIKQDRFVVTGFSSCIDAVNKCENNPRGAIVVINELIRLADSHLDNDEVSDDIKQWISDQFASALLSCVVIYGNKTNDWNNCLKVMLKIKKFITSKETQKCFDENNTTLKKNYEVGLHDNYVDSVRNSDSNTNTNNGKSGRSIFKWIGIAVVLLILYFNFGYGDSKDKKIDNNKSPVKTERNVNSTNTKKNEPTKAKASSKTKTPVAPIAKSDVRTGYDNTKDQIAYGGNASVTIDNSKNNMPVYVRIWDTNAQIPVRAFYITQGDSFTADSMVSGNYEVRYIELYDNDVPAKGNKSQRFYLEDNGYSYSEVTLTLYKVAGGNMHTTPISADEI